MRKNILITESQLKKLVEKFSSEEEFDDFLDDENSNYDEDGNEDEIIDYGFDIEEPSDEDDFSERIRRSSSLRGLKPSSMSIGSSERWSKEDEKPFNPLKSSDMSLEKYLKTKKKS